MSKEKRNISVIKDADGNKIVMINYIKFKGKNREEWKEIERYLKKYIGKSFEIEEYSEKIYISKDFPDEFANSKSRIKLKGPLSKAKANSSLMIPELIKIAKGKKHKENEKEKHKRDAMYGWYKYLVRFAIPVFNNDKQIERYNIYKAAILVRHSCDDKKYLYDIIGIEKETSSPLSHQ